MAGIFTNPITFAHVQARGGWQRQIMYAGAYMAIVGSLIAITAYSRGRWEVELLSGWMYTLIALQTGTALLFGGTRITAAIRRDLSDEMIDSIRLMPLPASQAVLGYILAGAAQGGAVMCANFVMGMIIAVPAGFAPGQWITANFTLIFFSLFIWVVVAMLSYLTRAAAVLVFGALALISIMQGIPALLLPGLAVLLTPLIGRSIFSMQNLFQDLAPQLASATVAQTAVGIVCFLAACRKFRRSDWPAFTPSLGIVMLLAWQMATVLGFYQFDQFRPRWFGRQETIPQFTQMIASLLVAMLIALLPVTAAVLGNVLGTGATNRSRIVHTDAVAGICIGLCMLVLVFPPKLEGNLTLGQSAGWTLVLVIGFIFSARYFTEWLVLKQFRGRAWIGGGALICILVVPLALDGLRNAWLTDPNDKGEMSALGTLSPIGFLVGVWADISLNLVPAAVFYALLTIGLALMTYRAGRVKLALPNVQG